MSKKGNKHIYVIWIDIILCVDTPGLNTCIREWDKHVNICPD